MNEQQTLATELLHEVKMSARRWFIAFLVMIIVEIITIVGFLWYITLPANEVITEYSQEMEDVKNSTATQMIGGNYNGKNETDGEEDLQTSGDKK